jgi:MFS transporter, OFA family, oxalate/formate antiporter
MILSSDYEAAFWWFGIGQGALVIVVALLLRAPEAGEAMNI